MSKYLPRFKPEVYLRFLNKYTDFSSFTSADNKIYYMNFTYDNGENIISIKANGRSIEECLDQAILATGFERDL